MKKSSVLFSRVFTSLFLILYIFAQPLLAIESLIPTQDDTNPSSTTLQKDSIPTDTQESILDAGISDPEYIAKEEEQIEEASVPLPVWMTKTSSATTSLPVVIDQTYIYPLSPEVTLTFTKLPEVSSSVTISTISLTQGEITATGATSNMAYDITTDMVDGTFEYDLTLPSDGDSSVVYAENRMELLSGGTLVENNISQEGNLLTIDDLDHFTVFVVTTDIPPLSDTTTPTCVDAGATSNSNCYNDIQSAINAASDGDTINVKAGVYEISSTININKELQIIGPSSGIAKIIQTSNPAVSAFSISSDNVTLSNLEITNAEYFPENHIEVTNALVSIPNNAAISGVTISNNNIYSNYAPGTLQKDMYTRGITAGINATSGVSILGNTISNVRNGIVIQTGNSSITNNNVIFNTKGGIMHYTSSFVDAANRSMNNNSWTDIHNEWDIVWNSATYGFPNYQDSVINTSVANNDAYVLDLRRETSTVVANLTGNRSPIFVTSTGLDKVHQSSGNPAEPFATLQYAIDTVTPGGTIYLLSDLDITSEIIIDKPLTIEGNGYTIFSKFTKTDNSNNSGIGIHSDNVTIKNLTADGQFGTNLHGINIYVVTGILLDHVTALNNNAGIIVNGSIVTVKNVTTSGNLWGGINVDLGTGVTSEARLTVQGTSSHSEWKQIWIDDYRELASVVDVENQYDFSDFGYTRVYHLKMAAPEILGWNVKNSPTDTPDTPRPSTELTCNSFTNINGASSHWTDVSGGDSNIKYQRQYRYDLGSGWTGWAGSEIYSNPYTDFRVFGSSTGNQGIYDTRVRAFYDLNSNNTFDTGEFYSDWGSGCTITFDNTVPETPEIIFPNPEQYFNTTPILNDWTNASDTSGIASYRVEYIYDDNHTFSNAPYRTTIVSQRNHTPGEWEQGGIKFRVQAFDNAGNEGSWSDWRHYFYDITAPEVPSGIYFKDTDNNKDLQCGAFTNTKHLDVYWNEIVGDPSFDHFEYSSFNAPNGSAGLVEKIFTTNYFNSSWWTVPQEGTYGVQLRSVDKAGNKSAWYGGTVGIDNSCQFKVDWTAPSVEITSHKDGNIVKGTTTISGDIFDTNLLRYWFVVQNSSGSTVAGPNTVNSNGPSVTKTFNWNTTSLPDGTYTIKLEARDKADNKLPNQSPVTSDPEVLGDSVDWATVIVDNTSPVSTFNEDLSGQSFNSDITISGSSLDVNGVSEVNLFYKLSSDITWLPLKTLTNPDTSVNPFNWYYIWDPAVDGTYDIKASAVDLVGNSESSPMMTGIIFDTEKPTIGNVNVTIDYLSKYVNGLTGFFIWAPVHDTLSDIDTSSCMYTLDGSTWANGSFTHDNCVFGVSSNQLFDNDALNIKVSVKDKASNMVTSTVVERKVDKALPQSQAVIDEIYYGPNSLPVVKGTASDTVSDITMVMISLKRNSDNRYWIAGNLWLKLSTPLHTTTGTDNWILNQTLPSLSNSVTYTVTPYAWDQVHLSTQPGITDAFIWDNQAPNDPTTIIASHFVGTASKDNTIDIDFSGANDDLSGVKGFYYSFSNTPETPVVSTSNWLPYLTPIIHVSSQPLTDGTWYFNVRTIDNVGNITSTAHSGPYTIDTTPAVINWTSQLDGTINNTSVVLGATTNEVMNNFRFRWMKAGESWVDGPNNTNHLTNYQYTFDPIDDGVYTVRAQGRDLALNWSKASPDQVITIDRTPPRAPDKLKFKNPDLECGSVTNSYNITAVWDDNGDNLTGVKEFVYYVDTPGVMGYQTTVTPTQYAGAFNQGDGVYTFKVKAIDNAGNESDWSSSCSITYDSTNPIVDLTAPTGLIAGTHDVKASFNDLNPSEYTYSITNTATSSKVTLATVTSGEFTDLTIYTWNTTATDDGEYEIFLRGTDLAGNSVTDSETVNVDNTKPTASTLGALTFTVGSTTPRIITLTDNHELSQVCYTFTGAFTCLPISGTTQSWDVSNLINTLGVGNATFSYYVVDSAGNQSDFDSLTPGDLEYVSNITVNDIPEVLGATDNANGTGTGSRYYIAQGTSDEENTGDEEQQQEETELTQPDQNDPTVLAATDLQDEGKTKFPWWGYAIIAAILFFIFFIIWRQKKERKEQGYY